VHRIGAGRDLRDFMGIFEEDQGAFPQIYRMMIGWILTCKAVDCGACKG
jgi:hypothetical protein